MQAGGRPRDLDGDDRAIASGLRVPQHDRRVAEERGNRRGWIREKARPGYPQLGPHDPAVAGVEVDAGRGAEVEGRALERLRREHETGTEGADLGVAVAVLARVRQPGEGLQERLAERGGEAKAIADGAGRAEAERVGVAARRDRDAAEGENARRVDPRAVDADEALGLPARIRRPGRIDRTGDRVGFSACAEAGRLDMRIGEGDTREESRAEEAVDAGRDAPPSVLKPAPRASAPTRDVKPNPEAHVRI